MRFAADAFAFKPPADSTKVELSALDNIDEIPRGVRQRRKEMTRAAYRLLQVTLAIGVGSGVLSVNDQASLIDSGDAGHGGTGSDRPPADPMSYAGVARRTTRRAVYGAAAVGSRRGRRSGAYAVTPGLLPGR